MAPEQKYKLRVLRNYVKFVNEWTDRPTGVWGDHETPSNTHHYADPRESEWNVFANPFVMIETSHYNQTWVTLWADPDDAVDYHQGQEYAEDWRIDMLVDIRDMTEYRLSAKAVKA